MKTRMLLMKLMIWTLVLIPSLFLFILSLMVPNDILGSIIFKALALTLVCLSTFSLIFGLQSFFRDKHALVISHKWGAMKKIWYEQRWTLLTAFDQGNNNLKINIHFSNEMDTNSMANMVHEAAKGVDGFNANMAANSLMKDSGMRPDQN